MCINATVRPGMIPPKSTAKWNAIIPYVTGTINNNPTIEYFLVNNNRPEIASTTPTVGSMNLFAIKPVKAAMRSSSITWLWGINSKNLSNPNSNSPKPNTILTMLLIFVYIIS